MHCTTEYNMSNLLVNACRQNLVSETLDDLMETGTGHADTIEGVYHGTAFEVHIIASGNTQSTQGPRTRPTHWYCCKCKDGPKVIAIQPSCIECGHVKCSQCRVV